MSSVKFGDVEWTSTLLLFCKELVWPQLLNAYSPPFSVSNPKVSLPLLRHLVVTVSISSTERSSGQGPHSVQVRRSVQSMHGTINSSTATPPLTLLVILTSLVPSHSRVLLLNGVSWHWWETVTDSSSSHSKGSVQEGRAWDLHTPPGQGRLKVLKA